MSYRKNRKITEKLKHEDSDISVDANVLSANSNLIEKYSKARGNVGSVFSKKNKFPLGLDIFVSVLLIALVAALVVGAYFLIDRFNDSYDDQQIEYVLLVDKALVTNVLNGDNLYVDKDGSAIYFGRVSNIDKNVVVYNEKDGGEYVLLTVHADVLYRDNEGYNLEGIKIAVGRSLTARVGGNVFEGEIISLTKRTVTSK